MIPPFSTFTAPVGLAVAPPDALPRMQALVESLPLAVLEFRWVDGGLRLQSANAAARRLPWLGSLTGSPPAATVFDGVGGADFVSAVQRAASHATPAAPITHVEPLPAGERRIWQLSAYGTQPGCAAVWVQEVTDTVLLAEVQRDQREQRDVFDTMESVARMGHWRRRPNEDGEYALWSAGLMAITGVTDGPWVGIAAGRSGIVAEDLPAFLQARATPGHSIVDFRWRRSDGEVRWMRAQLRQPLAGDPVPLELGVVQDVTEERHVSEQMREQLDLIRRIAGSVPGCIFQYRIRTDGTSHVPYISEAVRELLLLEPADVMRDFDLLASRVLPDDVPRVHRASLSALHQMRPWQSEYRVQMPNGEIRWHMTSAVPQLEPDGAVLCHGFMMDITDRKKAEQEIERLAFYDALTGLPNRRLLLDRLQRACSTCQRHHQLGALLFIDLDNFKDLNDTLGHDMGDQLLAQVAQRLVASVRESDTVARFGGDEFVVMLENLDSELAQAALQAEHIADKLLAQLNQPFSLGQQDHYSTPSIGITLFGDQRHSVDELLKRADLAMYQAKAAGRNTQRFFDPDMQAQVNARSHLEADLRQGLARGELSVHYQPIVDHRAQLSGAEALVRWKHPERGMISPADFIPLAEQTGLILPLGHYVLRTACDQLVAWSQAPETAQLSISVNVSARQFRQPGFAAEVLQTLQDSGANPQRLKLELTESLLLGDIEDTIERMGQLKREGVGFSLDDFGTGYSSLSYLKRLPLDQVKIDQGFVRDVLTDPNDAAIVRTILALAKSLDLQVVAEGVETTGQLAFLRLHGCEGFQGYLFGRPGPVEGIHALLD